MDIIEQINSVFISQIYIFLTSAPKSIFSLMLLFDSNYTLRKEMERAENVKRWKNLLETIKYKSQFCDNKFILGQLPFGICFFFGHFEAWW